MNAPFPAAPPPKRGMPTWLIVLLCTGGAFVVIVPLLAVIAIYGVRKYVANAKQAEARSAVGELAKEASAAFDRSRRLCASASHPVPASIAMVRASKYQSSAADWAADGAHAGFACLGFSMTEPQYYQYAYTATDAPEGSTFDATAHGDLDGDGAVSTFTATGTIGPAGVLVIAPLIAEEHPEE
jgi:type IV pilus assembly protein PilA